MRVSRESNPDFPIHSPVRYLCATAAGNIQSTFCTTLKSSVDWKCKKKRLISCIVMWRRQDWIFIFTGSFLLRVWLSCNLQCINLVQVICMSNCDIGLDKNYFAMIFLTTIPRFVIRFIELNFLLSFDKHFFLSTQCLFRMYWWYCIFLLYSGKSVGIVTTARLTHATPAAALRPLRQ